MRDKMDIGSALYYLKSKIIMEFSHAFIGTLAAILSILDISIRVYEGARGPNPQIATTGIPTTDNTFNGTHLIIAIIMWMLAQVVICFFWHKIQIWTAHYSISLKSIIILTISILVSWLSVANAIEISQYMTFHLKMENSIALTLFVFLTFCIGVYFISTFTIEATRENPKYENEYMSSLLVSIYTYLIFMFVLGVIYLKNTHIS